MISDTEIRRNIAAKNTVGWSNLYDKYAAIMYGFILQITDIQVIAQEILVQSFIELKVDSLSLKFNKSLCVGLLVHTHTNALRILKKNALQPLNGHSLSQLLKIYCTNEIEKTQ